MTATVYNVERPYSTQVTDAGEALISRYAWGDDYHQVIGKRLDALLDWMHETSPERFEARAYVDLDPYDVISFPPGVARRLSNVTYDEPDREHLLMFVIGGNSPQAEFTPAAMRRCEQHAAGKAKTPVRRPKARSGRAARAPT